MDLGAEVVRVDAADVVAGLERVARSHRATHLVLPHREVVGLRKRLERPPIDRLLERLPELEVHVIGLPARRG